MSISSSNFDFLDKDFPVLAKFGRQAEQYCYTDSNSCLMKLGMIGETIVNLIFTYDRIPVPYDDSAVAKIDVLYREGQIDRELCDILHSIRKARNKAVHENYSSVDVAKTLLQMAYSLCEWFMQTYGDWTYKHHDFFMPSERQESVVPEKNEASDAVMVQHAEKAAESSPVVPPEERKKRAMQAASQRQRTEAETRYLIDEQLRQVGWEADTQNLRYSKGTRPQKGHNMAIAEWPTDSTVGNRGFADYALFIDTKMVGIIEAKAEHKDIPSVIDYQGKDYPKNIRNEDRDYVIGNWGEYKVPFTFATNGRPYLEQLKTKSGIWFLDLRKDINISTALRGWLSPTGIQELLEKDINAGKSVEAFGEDAKALITKEISAFKKNISVVFNKNDNMGRYFLNTMIMWIMGFVPQILISLLLAVWFTNTELNLKFQRFFKTVIYMPNLIMAAAFSMLFYAMFSPSGPINGLLAKFYTSMSNGSAAAGAEFEPVRFFSSTGWTRGLVATMNFLMWYGNTTIMLMAGVMGIDTSIFEAARIDGAGPFKTFFKITLPLLLPIFVYVLITSLIGGIQMFDVPQILTNGKGTPNRTTMTIIMKLNNHLFSKNYGPAGITSILIFAITGILSGVVYKTTMQKYTNKR